MTRTLAKRLSGWTLCAALTASGATWLLAADYGQYRGFRLGSSVDAVVKAAASPSSSVRTLHQRPSLLQEFTWRPPYTSSPATTAAADPVREIVFTFVDDQLFKVAAAYDRRRTEGLTRADVIEALTGTYGATVPLPVQPRPRASEGIDSATPVAQWRTGDVTVVLQEYEYTAQFVLVIASVPLEQLARQAQAAAIAQDAREAPMREAARAKQVAAAARDEAEKTRTTNKAGFRP